MSDNMYNAMGSGRPDLGEGVEGEPGLVEGGATQNKQSAYKKQMVRANAALVALFLGGAAVIYGLSLGKKPAKASAEQQMAESRVDSAILRISQESNADATGRSSGRVTQRVLKCFYEQVSDRQIPLSRLRKNPFMFVPPSRASVSNVTNRDNTKPMTPIEIATDDSYEKAMAVLKTLHLQSIMKGSNGETAIISNNLLAVGQEIEGFTVDSIGPKWVVLVWRDKKFILEMQ